MTVAAAQQAAEYALPMASLAVVLSSFLVTRSSTPHTPRRAPILSVEALLAATYLGSGVAGLVEVVLAKRWSAGSQAAFAYALGGLATWAAVGCSSEWSREWDKWWVKTAAVLGLAGEATLLGLAIKQAAFGHTGPFDIVALALGVARVVLLLPLLALLAFPLPASVDGKTTSSSAAPLLANTGNGHAETAPGYGTFPGSAGASSAASTAATDKKEPDEAAQSWGSFLRRLYSLGLIDRLWPKDSVRLQLCCVVCVGIVLAARGVNALAPLSLGKLIDALSTGQGASSCRPPSLRTTGPSC